MGESNNFQKGLFLDHSELPSITEWEESQLYGKTPLTYGSDNSCERLYQEVCCEPNIDSGNLECDFPADSLSRDSEASSSHWHEDFETLKPNFTSTRSGSDTRHFGQEPFGEDESKSFEKCSEVIITSEKDDSHIYDSIADYSRDLENTDIKDKSYKKNQYQIFQVQPSPPPKISVHTKIGSTDGLYKLKNFVQKGITENSKKKKQKKWQMFRKSANSIFIDTPDILGEQFIRDATVQSAPSTDENRNSWSKTHTRSLQSRHSPNQTPSQNTEATIGSNEEETCKDKYNLIAYEGSHDSDESWGSDEFDSSSLNDESEEEENYSTKPLPPPPPPPTKKFSVDTSQAYGVIEKIRNLTSKEESDSEDESICFPVTLRPEKFRPPHLPPTPTGLTVNQIKRRCVVECIILSEKSYIESLQRIKEDYEEPILEMVGVQKLKIRNSLKKLREILNYHHMFQIELADRVNCWDEKETIGDIFMASFSKSMVFDAYSIYVNNFSAAMEEIKNLQRTRQSFRDFLKQKETNSGDRLSIFGLMVKPIQRFPQFIMCLQDLLKYTPKDHVDRRALQLAVTVLENLAHKLNEHKRENEQNFAAKQILTKIREGLTKHHLTSHNKFLIRQDNMLQIVNQAQPTKSKKRRLFMLNDTLICVNVMYRERDGEVTERYKHKWTVPLKDVELNATTSITNVHSSFPLWTGETGTSSRIDSFESDSQETYDDLCNLNYDYRILEDISKLVSSLKCSYEILTEELLHEMLRDLQCKIQDKHEQINLVDGCSIELILPDKSGKVSVLLQAASPSAKQKWCLDFQIAKLALSPQNQPGWDIPVLHNTDQLTDNLPAYFVSSLPIDVSTHSSQVQCAVGVYLPSGHVGVPHVWVCNTVPDVGGQVSIISVQTSQNILTLTESFPATSTEIMCVEKIPGTGLGTTFSAVDTVWMATIDQKMYVYGLHNPKGNQREALKVFSLPAVAKCLKYTGDKLFVALNSGSVLIFKKQEEEIWDIDNPEVVKLDTKPVTCLLESPSDGCVLAAHSNTISIINQSTRLLQSYHKLSGSSEVEHIVPAGVGLWVSYKSSSIIHLYHIENLDLLQEINVSSAGTRVSQTDCLKECTVSCLLASRGMLWIGTNVGLLLSFPLPRLRNGVPIVSGRPYVSYHGHKGAIKFLLPFTSAFETKSPTQSSPDQQNSFDDQEDLFLEVEPPKSTKNESDNNGDTTSNFVKKMNTCSPCAPLSDQFQEELKEKLSQRYRSAPNLLDIDEDDDMQTLYGSLMRGTDHVLSRTQSLMKRPSKQSSTPISQLGIVPGHVSSPAIVVSGHQSGQDRTCVAAANNNNLDFQVESKPEKSNPEILNNRNFVKTKIKAKISCNTTMTTNTLNYRDDNNSNSTIIVSGGNGYQCWNAKQYSDLNREDNDASLLFWIYKQ